MTWWSKIQTMILNPCNLQWGLGGFGTAHVLRRFCFRHQGMFCTPAKCKSSPCSQDSFAPASLVFHANLGRKPYIALVLVAPEMFELLAMNFQNTVFFFNFFWEFNLGFLCAWRIWWQWWGVARAVPSPWAQQFHLRGRWNGGLISTDQTEDYSLSHWWFYVKSTVVFWIGFIFIFWLLIVLWLLPFPACTNVHW